MREIKCRGYNKELQKWIIGSYVDGYIINGVMESNEEYIVIERWAPVEKESVGQYTGLKDKNGVEVYEGGIVKAIDRLGHVANKFIGLVSFDNASFTIKDDLWVHYRWVDYDIEVIGNIHENPELLEED